MTTHHHGGLADVSAIAGIVDFSGGPVKAGDLERMVASMPDRGRGGHRMQVRDNVGLAHLAFTQQGEPVAAPQPLRSPDGRFSLVADARLDNRADLARALDIDAAESVGMDDAALLLRAYQRWGGGCVDHLLGDFVFAAWDAAEQSLFLARDALGAHGLVVHHAGSRCVFASEIDAVLDLPDIRVQANDDAVLKTLGGVPLAPGETFFRGLSHLPPAHGLTITAKGPRTRRYWAIDPDHRLVYRDAAEYTDHFLDLVEQAVACRLRGGGPVGISLSGGCDSTLLAAVAARQLAADAPARSLRSFSYVFDRFAACDERQWIEPVVARHDLDAHYINADRFWTFAGQAERTVPRDHLWTNAYARLPEAIAEAAGSTGCQVLIDGLYGDALFGEPSLFAADLIAQGRWRALRTWLRDHGGEAPWGREILRRGLWPLAPAALRRAVRRARRGGAAHAAPFLDARHHPRLKELRAQAESTGTSFHGLPSQRLRQQLAFQPEWAQGFAVTRAVPYNRAGVERVSPYFDRRLVEFVLAIPAEQISHAGRPRRLQRQAMQRLLPETVCERQSKTSFEPLLQAGWENERTWIEEMTRDPLAVRQGWIDVGWLQSAMNTAAPQADMAYDLALCLHLELWLRALEPA